MKIAAVILAAGASERMGRPKALLDYRGQPFAKALVNALSAACSPVIVVLGHNADEVQRAAVAEGRAVQFVTNPAPERGQLSSLQCGLRAVPADAAAVAFSPVDLPAMEPQTVQRLAEAFEGAPGALVIPRYRGRHGHPVIAGRALIAEFLDLPETAAAHDIIHRHRDQTKFIDVEDPGVVHDVDTPADYDRLKNPE